MPLAHCAHVCFRVFFEMKYGMSPGHAGAVNSIVYILSAVASPIFGFLIDRTGRSILWIIGGIVFTLGAHALFAFSFFEPIVCMVSTSVRLSVERYIHSLATGETCRIIWEGQCFRSVSDP